MINEQVHGPGWTLNRFILKKPQIDLSANFKDLYTQSSYLNALTAPHYSCVGERRKY